MVGLGASGYLQDLYYPYVGLENHVNARNHGHRIGVWVDGSVSWLDDRSWQVEQDYDPDGMIGLSRATNPQHRLKIEFTDFVDSEVNVFARHIKLTNLADEDREVRLFLHQVFLIAESRRDVTCQYLPQEHVLMHYRGRRVFIIGGEHADKSPFDQFAIGLHGIEGQDGTYRDADDGNLSGNAVEHGIVDSTLRFTHSFRGQSSATMRYWISAGISKQAALGNHRLFKGEGFSERLELTRDYWREWQAIGANKLHRVDPDWQEATRKNLLIIKSHLDRRGGVIASGDSEMLNYMRDYYSYCWPRDAAYVLKPLIRMGYYEEAKNYFEFARDVIHQDGYLEHKYQTDRSLGSSWHPYLHNRREELPIQEDETASTIILLNEYLNASGDEDFVRAIYDKLVQAAANWMDTYIDSATKLPHASYDLWEQKFLTSTYTVGVVYGALQAAADLADRFEYPDDAIRWRTAADDIKRSARESLFNHERGYFYKGLLLGHNDMVEYDPVIDASSLYGAVVFGLYELDDEYVKTAVATLEATLLNRSAVGGMPRYEHDDYYRAREDSLGNIWFVTSLWFAQYLIEVGQVDRAREIVQWARSHMLSTGALPEQIDADSGQHLSVEPLVWSQAEFINTVLDLA